MHVSLSISSSADLIFISSRRVSILGSVGLSVGLHSIECNRRTLAGLCSLIVFIFTVLYSETSIITFSWTGFGHRAFFSRNAKINKLL